MIEKKILSETTLYHGEIKMPEGFEIEREELSKNIFYSKYYENVDYPFSRTFDKLKTFITDFIRIEHKYNLVPKKIYGDYFEKNENSKLKSELNLLDLKNSADFVLLYGVEIDPNTCTIEIHYDNNRRKGNTWSISLENNKFVMFPTSQSYYIKNIKNSYLNFIQIITFEYI
jgi:hypothetical protein